jgi:hypothetical protein
MSEESATVYERAMRGDLATRFGERDNGKD